MMWIIIDALTVTALILVRTIVTPLMSLCATTPWPPERCCGFGCTWQSMTYHCLDAKELELN